MIQEKVAEYVQYRQDSLRLQQINAAKSEQLNT
jgi:hypothetical protein